MTAVSEIIMKKNEIMPP